MFSSVGQIAITVKNVESSVHFYRDVLGLKFLFSAGPNLSFLQVGDVRLMLSLPEGEAQPGTGMVIYLKTDDLDRAYQRILANGGEGIDPPHLIAEMSDHDLWMAFVKDPDGYLIGLMQEKLN